MLFHFYGIWTCSDMFRFDLDLFWLDFDLFEHILTWFRLVLTWFRLNPIIFDLISICSDLISKYLDFIFFDLEIFWLIFDFLLNNHENIFSLYIKTFKLDFLENLFFTVYLHVYFPHPSYNMKDLLGFQLKVRLKTRIWKKWIMKNLSI